MHGMSQGASTEAIIFSQQKWKLSVDLLCVDHQSAPPPGSTEVITFSCKSECWLLILSMLIINPPPPRINSVDCLHVDHWLPLHWVSITSTLIINLPPRINSVDCLCTDCWLSLHWASITSTLIVDLPPPRINSVDHLCINHWSSITSTSTVDRPPYRFQLSNL